MQWTEPGSPRGLARRGLIGVCLCLAFGLMAVAACSAGGAKDAIIRELAIGSWACEPDVADGGELPFTVTIEDDGVFAVSWEEDPEGFGVPGEIPGSWSVSDGDLDWSFDALQSTGLATVEGVDSLTLESTEFTLKWSEFAGLEDDSGSPIDEEDVQVEANGTDSVTMSMAGGDPWTCNRQ